MAQGRRVFAASAAPPGCALGRWEHKEGDLWEGTNADNSEVSEFRDVGPSATPGSKTIRLRSAADQSTEVLLLQDTAVVYSKGEYVHEYIGRWEIAEDECPPPPPTAELPFSPAPAEAEAEDKAGGPPPPPAELPAPPAPAEAEAEEKAGGPPPPPAEAEEKARGLPDDVPAPPAESLVPAPAPAKGLAATVAAPPSAPVAAPSKLMAASIPGARGPSAKVQPRAPQKAKNLDRSPQTVAKLEAAARSGDAAAIAGLVAAAADPDGAGPDGGTTPVLLASTGGHLAAVEALIKAGADINIAKDGNTPMTVAFQKGHKDVLKALFGATFHTLEGAVNPGEPQLMGTGVLQSTVMLDEETVVANMTGELKGITGKWIHMTQSPAHVPRGAPELDDLAVPTPEQAAAAREQATKGLLMRIQENSRMTAVGAR